MVTDPARLLMGVLPGCQRKEFCAETRNILWLSPQLSNAHALRFYLVEIFISGQICQLCGGSKPAAGGLDYFGYVQDDALANGSELCPVARLDISEQLQVESGPTKIVDSNS